MNDDNRRSAWNRGPEIIAHEQQILTLADALLTWMRQRADLGTLLHDEKYSIFFTHELPKSNFNPFGQPVGAEGVSKQWLLEKMDPDANRFFAELLRAAWHRRHWREHYGEITQKEKYES